jgi:hypothetical protein
MVFSADELWKAPDLTKLPLVDVRGAPTYQTNSSHFIGFQSPDTRPDWCSKPTQAKLVRPADWLSKDSLLNSSEDVAKYLATVQHDVDGLVAEFVGAARAKGLDIKENRLPESLTILELEKATQTA